jgi:hypothetical protein
MAIPHRVDIVYLDGIQLGDALVDISLETTDLDRVYTEFVSTGKPNIRVRIKGPQYTIDLNPEAMEREEHKGIITYHFYGILPKLMPELFKDKLLLDWQKAYLQSRNEYTLLDEYKFYRDDVVFTRLHAVWFEKGWNEHAKQTTE